MTDQEAIQMIIKHLDDAATALKAKQIAPSDCIESCSSAYDSCMASAGSILEKAVCKAAYNKCIANC